MDFMLDKEFHALFDRVAAQVDLKGAYTVDAINERIRKVFFELEAEKKDREWHAKRVPKRITREQKQLDKLMEYDRFASRAINELIVHPYGSVALTVRYGRKRAREILLKRAMERRGRMRMVKAPRRPIVRPRKWEH